MLYPDGTSRSCEYNEINVLTALIEPDGMRWHWEYDERGNLTSETGPDGARTCWTVDDAGRLTSVTDPLGATTHLRCDGAGLVVETTGPLGNCTTVSRDAFGRVREFTDPLGTVTRTWWTVEGWISRLQGPDGTDKAWSYDGENNCLAYTDAVGQTTRFEYTHFDLPISRTDPDGSRYEFTYDSRLRLTAVTNPAGQTWAYTYDSANHLVAESDFANRAHAYTRDAIGRLTARTTPLGERITYAYDALGRLTGKTVGDQRWDYLYDDVGRLVTATGANSRLARRYDPTGRITAEVVDGRELTFSYDLSGRLIDRTTPTDATTAYTYDPAGRCTRLATSGHTLDFAYDAAGRETTRRLGAHLTTASEWDPAGRLVGQALTAGPRATLVQRRTYAYRGDGYLTGVDDHLNGPARFTLDAANMVTGVTASEWQEYYAYDAVGNQTAAAWPAAADPIRAAGERIYAAGVLTAAGSLRHHHDEAGRIVLRQRTRLSKKPESWRFTYDAEDRLTSAVTPDGSHWRYRYDPLGRRTCKQRLTDTGQIVEQTAFTYDGPTLIEAVTSGGALPQPVAQTWEHTGLAPATQLERHLDGASQEEIDARFFAIVTDQIGTPRELVTEDGHLAWRARTTLWGTTTWTSHATAHTPLRFPGQYHDAETGLHYNLHRYYDPATAHYTTPDPLGLAAAPHPTAYPANPHTQADPLGLSPYAATDARIINTSSTLQHNRAAMDLNGPNGFSGVYDPATGNLEARLSGGPNALVDRAGGHGQINREVFDASGDSVGFVAIRREDFVEMRWNSYSVNYVNFGDRAAPMEFRQPIMDTIGRMTGLPVVG
ncbi:RHS repeat-associated core domain-containing protein [Streptomyces sp. MAR4 CNY-716]